MYLYNLDTKVTNKSYEILNNHMEEQRQLDSQRVSELRSKCRDILSKNGIFEDKKNGIVYQTMEKELAGLEHSLDYFNEYHFEEITKSKIDSSIENITSKLECLEQKNKFTYEDDEYVYNKAYSESNIQNMIYTYFEYYKANTIELLLKAGYSQNTIDGIEEDILQYLTSKSSNVLTEKISQDRLKGVESLSIALNNVTTQVLNEAEARFRCQQSGQCYDELKEKRDAVKLKAQRLEEIRMQIASIDMKSNELNKANTQTSGERIILQ